MSVIQLLEFYSNQLKYYSLNKQSKLPTRGRTVYPRFFRYFSKNIIILTNESAVLLHILTDSCTPVLDIESRLLVRRVSFFQVSCNPFRSCFLSGSAERQP